MATIEAISKVEPKRRTTPSLGAAATVGALAGTAARYVLPSKNDASLINKDAVDTFVSSTAKRAANRSILKYGGIGALIAVGANLIHKALKKDDTKNNNVSIEYTKLGALIDAPDYACEIMWYGE